MKPYFLTEQELSRIDADHPIVLFGAGILGEKTLNLLTKKPLCFVDNDSKKQRDGFKGSPVLRPEGLPDLVREEPDLYVVICVEKYNEVVGQLSDAGLAYGNNAGITPMSSELSIIENLWNHSASLLFSNYDERGGLYLLELPNGRIEKLLDGSVRGFVKVGDDIYCASKKGLHRIDSKRLEVTKDVSLGRSQVYGLTYDPSRDQLVMATTESDEISFIDRKSLDIVDSVSISDKSDRFGKESHHINDILVVGDYLLISVFSLSGWWRYGFHDAGLIELHRGTGDMKFIPIEGAWMPHSLMLQDGEIIFLDSMNGTLRRGLTERVAEFNGYVRGLEFNGHYCYIGQSVHRHLSRVKNRLNTSIDSGVHILDLENRASRFVKIDHFSNIYQIMNIDWKLDKVIP